MSKPLLGDADQKSAERIFKWRESHRMFVNVVNRQCHTGNATRHPFVRNAAHPANVDLAEAGGAKLLDEIPLLEQHLVLRLAFLRKERGARIAVEPHRGTVRVRII